jgi:hypothetical protein
MIELFTFFLLFFFQQAGDEGWFPYGGVVYFNNDRKRMNAFLLESMISNIDNFSEAWNDDTLRPHIHIPHRLQCLYRRRFLQKADCCSLAAIYHILFHSPLFVHIGWGCIQCKGGSWERDDGPPYDPHSQFGWICLERLRWPISR